MKKIVTMLLVVVMVLGLAACGSKTTTETKAPTEADVSATTAAATEAPTEAKAEPDTIVIMAPPVTGNYLTNLKTWADDFHALYPNLTVDVHHPELTVYLEVRDYAAYVHADPEPGAGGLPVGVGGRAVSLLSGGIDSPVASWMIAKRGIALEMVHFFSYPYTSEEAKQKVLTLAKLLTPWCGRLTVHVVPFTAIQEELRRKCPEELFTVLMRRFMMRIAEAVAQRCGAGAIVTGECLGQVASQTMEAMRATTAVTTLPILRPVVGMDKEEIVRIARKINTFETSILPYEDCCTVFTPRHPRLRPVLGELEAAEAALDVEGLVKAAVDGIERVQV